jgi:hypothetical protein
MAMMTTDALLSGVRITATIVVVVVVIVVVRTRVEPSCKKTALVLVCRFKEGNGMFTEDGNNHAPNESVGCSKINQAQRLSSSDYRAISSPV